MLIRQERPADRGQVYELIKAAFATAEHADRNEQDLVEARGWARPLSRSYRWWRRRRTAS